MNVVYLLGAGASAHAVPVLRGINSGSGLNECINVMFRNFLDRKGPFAEYSKEDYQFIDNWLTSKGLPLSHQFFQFTTPDTLARKFYLNNGINSSELSDLKYALCLFFLFWNEAINTPYRSTLQQVLPSLYDFAPIDDRYYGFLTTLLSRKGDNINFEPNIKILSWNYDSQIEEVLAEIDIKAGQSIYLKPNILEKFKIDAFDENKNLSHNNIIKLNGTYFDSYNPLEDNNTSLLDNMNEPIWFEQALRRLDVQMNKGMGNPPTLKFAWENNIPQFELGNNDNTLGFQSLKEIMRNAHRLVVIGYTFPHYNREMDRFILQSFTLNGQLTNENKLIHIQNTPEGIQGNKERIQALTGLNDKLMVGHTYLEEFFIPSEL